MIRGESLGKSPEIRAVARIAKIEIERDTRRAAEDEGDASDDDKIHAGGAKDVKEPLDVGHVALLRGTAPCPASAPGVPSKYDEDSRRSGCRRRRDRSAQRSADPTRDRRRTDRPRTSPT